MFKLARWRSEKNKVKAVFELQFQATQVPGPKRKNLTISVIPEDVGKPTVRLKRVEVIEGTWYWKESIHEKVKFIKEPEMGRFREKIYHFVVSTGSSKAGFLGAASLDIAEFAEAEKPLIASLPLNTSNSGPILHIIIQRLLDSNGVRDLEEDEIAETTSEICLEDESGSCNGLGNKHPNFTEDENFNNEQYADPKILDGEATRNQNPHSENPIHLDLTTQMPNSKPQHETVDPNPKEKYVHPKFNKMEGSDGSTSDGSIIDAVDLPENFPRDRSPEASDEIIQRLKSEVFTLERQAEVSELELQSFRKQIMKECRTGEDLRKQIIILQRERDELKSEYERVESLQKCADETKATNLSQSECRKLRTLLNETREELECEKNLNSSLHMQLKKTDASNSELVLALKELDEMLEQKSKEISNLKVIQTSKNPPVGSSKCKGDCAEDKRAMKELSPEHDDTTEAITFDNRIANIRKETEIYEKENKELKVHLEQLNREHEILKLEKRALSSELDRSQLEQMRMENVYAETVTTNTELRLLVERLEKEVKMKGLEFSKSLETIAHLESQIKNLQTELLEQAQSFEDDLEAVTQSKIEQEHRTIRAEEALRNTKWSNGNTAKRLQEEFKKLSAEMASKFDEKEKQALKAAAEASELRAEKEVQEEMLQKANEEIVLIKDNYERKLKELLDQTDLQATQIEKMSFELDSKCNLVDALEKHEEISKMDFSIEIQRLKGEVDTLRTSKHYTSEEEEQNEENALNLLHSWGKERDKIESEIASLRKEAEKLQEDSFVLKILNGEKDKIMDTLHQEIQKLRVQSNELRQCFSEVNLGKENIRKHVSKLIEDLQKNEQAVNIIDRKSTRKTVDGTHSYITQLTSGEKSALLPYFAEYIINLTEKLRYLEEAETTERVISYDSKLEGRIESRESACHMVQSTAGGSFKQNGCDTAAIESDMSTCLEKELKSSISRGSGDLEFTELSDEVKLVKQRNGHLEHELKEMHDKYLEMSLKFAEVEGERQKLVMTLRNLINSKKK